MELDDIKSAWQSIERRLAAQNAMTFMVLKEKRTAQAKSALWPHVVGQILQLLFGVFLRSAIRLFFVPPLI